MPSSRLLQQIHKASARFLAPLTPEETFESIVEESIKLVGAKYGSILLEEDGQLNRIYSSDPVLYSSVPLKRGYAFQSFETKKAFAVGSRGLWRAHPELKDLGTRSVIFVPLIYADQSIGVLTLHLSKERKVADKKIKVLSLFATVASSAIRKTQLYNEAWEAIKDRDLHKNVENILEKIYQASLGFLVSTNLKDLYKNIVDESIKLVGAKHGSVFLYDGKELNRVYASDPMFYKVIPRQGGFVYSSFEGGKPSMIYQNELKEAQSAHPALKKLAAGSIIFIPLSFHGTRVGILTVQSAKNMQFSPRERDVLALFGGFATLALRNAQLLAESTDAVQARDLFISMASHELRTPLTAVNGYVQLLARKLDSTLHPQESKWAQELKWETSRLKRLINDLLAVDLIKKGELPYKFEPTDIADAVSRAIAEFKFSYPDHGIILRNLLKERNPQVLGDANKLAQVFTNILTNAGKFTPKNKQIKVILSSHRSNYLINIKDQGRGISQKDLTRIFEGFYKGEKNYEEGMGLGLFISKDIIKRHKGTISVESEIGKGTTLTIVLPKYKNGS